MSPEKNIIYLTILLSGVAGFCDTLTFVSAGELFSAHVTGNFIVFASNLTHNTGANNWLKLVTFPVFVLSIAFGGWVAGKLASRYSLLFIESLFLLAGGLIALLLNSLGMTTGAWHLFPVIFLLVFGMGLQNSFGRLFSKETLGPTTIMTGNVTQASLDSYQLFISGFNNPVVMSNLKKGLTVIAGFLIGCMAGAIAGNLLGLPAIILPAVLLGAFSLAKTRQAFFLTNASKSDSP